MEYSTIEPWQAMDINGIVYDYHSLYDHFMQMKDPRKERGKRYSLATLLVLIFLAKLCGADTPSAIAEWAKERSQMLVAWLHLEHAWMPHHNTYRRVFADVIDEEAFEQAMRTYQ